MLDKKKPSPKPLEALFDELQAVNWKKMPFRGLVASVADEFGVSKVSVSRSMRGRGNIEVALALLREKRRVERRIQEALACA